MPSAKPSEEFLRNLRRSKLIPERDLEAILATDPELSTKELSARLIEAGLLTPFQAKRIADGKARGFEINGKYRLLELIAVGGMGTVYLCEHILMRRLVAMKVLPKDQTGTPAAVERFLREGRAIASLDHPNIVRAFDLDRISETSYCLILEYIDGVSLFGLIKKTGPLPTWRAAGYTCQAALGLQHAHELGWVHRDIKPNNLLLSRQGVVKILDMGLARMFGQPGDNLTSRLEENAILGTLDYIAPEQAVASSKVDIRADIYSLGCTLYFMLTGRGPFPDGTVAQKLIWHQTSEPTPLTELRSDLPTGLIEVVRRMMAKSPAERFATPAEVATALTPWLTNDSPAPSEAEIPTVCPALRKYLNSADIRPMRVAMLPPPPMERTESETPIVGTIDNLVGPTWRGRPIHASGERAPLTGIEEEGFWGKWGWVIAAVVILGAILALVAVSAYQSNNPKPMPNRDAESKPANSE